MTYPYIGKREETGNTIIFLNENRGIRISEPFDFICTRDKWKESAFKNITAEYLANTYGEVKSKEHAEFIKLLAETNGIKLIYEPSNNIKSFEISGGGFSLYSLSFAEMSVEGLKQITIPLPPECESVGEWPKVNDDVALMSGKGKVVALPDNHGNYVIVTDKGFYLLASKDEIKKPKTPEQELRDDIEYAIHHFEGDKVAGRKWLMAKYNITKKGEGGE